MITFACYVHRQMYEQDSQSTNVRGPKAREENEVWTRLNTAHLDANRDNCWGLICQAFFSIYHKPSVSTFITDANIMPIIPLSSQAVHFLLSSQDFLHFPNTLDSPPPPQAGLPLPQSHSAPGSLSLAPSSHIPPSCCPSCWSAAVRMSPRFLTSHSCHLAHRKTGRFKGVTGSGGRTSICTKSTKFWSENWALHWDSNNSKLWMPDVPGHPFWTWYHEDCSLLFWLIPIRQIILKLGALRYTNHIR